MTHKDIYTKFMIEYDKADVTSSYPSLTEYEVATVLDKAYNALIAQKVTGNNYRRIPFEADIKAISDLQPLITSKSWGRPFSDSPVVINQLDFKLPDEKSEEGAFLYYVGCRLDGTMYKASTTISDNCTWTEIPSGYEFPSGIGKPSKAFVLSVNYVPFSSIKIMFDSPTGETEPTTWYYCYVNGSKITWGGQTVNTEEDGAPKNLDDLSKTMNSSCQSIILWPNVSLHDGDRVIWFRSRTQFDDNFPYDQEAKRSLPCQIVDYNTAQRFFTTAYNMPWIKNPVCYIHGDYLHVVKEDDTISNYIIETCTLTYIKKPATFCKDLVLGEKNKNFFDNTEFELNNTMAEELISLGIAMALENVESPRLNSKLNMRGLEA